MEQAGARRLPRRDHAGGPEHQAFDQDDRSPLVMDADVDRDLAVVGRVAAFGDDLEHMVLLERANRADPVDADRQIAGALGRRLSQRGGADLQAGVEHGGMEHVVRNVSRNGRRNADLGRCGTLATAQAGDAAERRAVVQPGGRELRVERIDRNRRIIG